MPTAIRHMLKPSPRESIIKIGNFFQLLCSKVVNLSTIHDLSECVAEALCLFEMGFPPGFFDIMTHLPVHLVEELYWCGPVHACWCYLVERYMGVLTNYVRDKLSPEASMASDYDIDKSLGFCTEFFQLYPHSKRMIWDANEELRDSREKLMGTAKQIKLT